MTTPANDNDRTIQSYNDHVAEYIAGTPQVVSGAVKDWIDHALALLPAGGHILELGSGFGRDADYFTSLGFKVDLTDAPPKFVDYLRSHGHPNARRLNALTDDFGGPYDMLFANAVLIHFNSSQVSEVLAKALASLKPGGILAVSLKQGDGEEWTEEKFSPPRHYTYWQKPALRAAIEEAGFSIDAIIEGTSTHRPVHWFRVVARKPD